MRYHERVAQPLGTEAANVTVKSSQVVCLPRYSHLTHVNNEHSTSKKVTGTQNKPPETFGESVRTLPDSNMPAQRAFLHFSCLELLQNFTASLPVTF